MRVQFTKEEELKIKDKLSADENTIIPITVKDKNICLDFNIIDPYKFNIFITKLMNDQNIAEQIGAKCNSVYLKPTMTPMDKIQLYNTLNEVNKIINQTCDLLIDH